MVFAKNDCLSWTRESPQMTSSGGRFRSSEGTPRKLLSIPLLEMSFVFCIHNIQVTQVTLTKVPLSEQEGMYPLGYRPTFLRSDSHWGRTVRPEASPALLWHTVS